MVKECTLENSFDSTNNLAIKIKKKILHDIYRLDRNNLTTIEIE